MLKGCWSRSAIALLAVPIRVLSRWPFNWHILGCDLQSFWCVLNGWFFLQIIWKSHFHTHIQQQPIFNTSLPIWSIFFTRDGQQISNPMLANVSRTHCILHNTGHGTSALSLKSWSSQWFEFIKVLPCSTYISLNPCGSFYTCQANNILPRCKNHGQQLYQWYLETSLLCWDPGLWGNRIEPAIVVRVRRRGGR